MQLGVDEIRKRDQRIAELETELAACRASLEKAERKLAVAKGDEVVCGNCRHLSKSRSFKDMFGCMRRGGFRKKNDDACTSYESAKPKPVTEAKDKPEVVKRCATCMFITVDGWNCTAQGRCVNASLWKPKPDPVKPENVVSEASTPQHLRKVLDSVIAWSMDVENRVAQLEAGKGGGK